MAKEEVATEEVAKEEVAKEEVAVVVAVTAIAGVLSACLFVFFPNRIINLRYIG
jgi:hypothetical protein